MGIYCFFRIYLKVKGRKHCSYLDIITELVKIMVIEEKNNKVQFIWVGNHFFFQEEIKNTFNLINISQFITINEM